MFLLLPIHGTSGKGIIKTFTIASDGSTITEIRSFNTMEVRQNIIACIQVDSDIPLAYTRDNDGFIKTFTIPSTSQLLKVTSIEQ